MINEDLNFVRSFEPFLNYVDFESACIISLLLTLIPTELHA